MANFPYFRWWPKDAETDGFYAGLTDSELGFYHRCLNLAWINGGIPSDPSERARTLKKTRAYADRMWKVVGKKFEPISEGMLGNPKQESEREWARTKSERNTNAVRSRYERSSNELQHAPPRPGSGSVSGSVVSGSEKLDSALKIASEAFDLTDAERAAAVPEIPGIANEQLDQAATRIHQRHPAPRRCTRGEVLSRLKAILRRNPAGTRAEILRTIDSNHEAYCETEQWTKDGGEFAKGLDNWLAPTKGRWQDPPARASPGLGELPGHMNPGLID